MKKIISLLLLTAFIVIASNALASPICGPRGEVLYKRHCSACHRDAAKLKAEKNIIEIIRNPPDVMPGFDREKISDRGVKEIADYIYQGSDFQVRSKKR